MAAAIGVTQIEASNQSGAVRLCPVDGGNDWRAEIDESLIILHDADGHEVLTLPDTDAAQHIRVMFDLRHGRVVHFTPMRGMKAFQFSCDKDNFKRLLDWLPKKSTAEVRREVLFQGFAMALAGPALMLWYQSIHLGWGIGLLLIGVLAMLWRNRAVYYLGGIFMFAFGIGQGFFPPPSSLPQTGLRALFPIVAAAGLLCWGVQQFSMLTLNAQIQSARTKLHLHPSQPSPLVRRVGRILGVIGVGFGLLAAGLWINLARGHEGENLLFEVDGATATATGVALFALLSCAMLLLRRNAGYGDAKACVQVVIAGTAVLLWTGPALFFQDSLPTWIDVQNAENPAVLAAAFILIVLLPGVLAFNYVFTRAMEKDLDEME